MVESKRKKRWESFAKVIQRMHKGGWFYPRDLKSELQLPDRTVDHNLKLGVYLGIFKRDEKTGSYAWVDYTSDEEIVREILETWFPMYASDIWSKEKLWPDSIDFIEKFVINHVAIKAGKDPHDIELRKTCYKVTKEFLANPEKVPPDTYERLRKRLEEFSRSFPKNPNDPQT